MYLLSWTSSWNKFQEQFSEKVNLHQMKNWNKKLIKNVKSKLCKKKSLRILVTKVFLSQLVKPSNLPSYVKWGKRLKLYGFFGPKINWIQASFVKVIFDDSLGPNYKQAFFTHFSEVFKDDLRLLTNLPTTLINLLLLHSVFLYFKQSSSTINSGFLNSEL